jgi:glycosyltransferase involved in cell wall biosynthesis
MAEPSPRSSCSIIIPAKNEADNLEACITRLPQLGSWMELIFVEGGSTDGTWETMLNLRDKYSDRLPVKCLQQTGTGKRNAIDLGFAHAQGDILIILDADLTVPPEAMTLFYETIDSGKADLANGCRLCYPLSYRAMPLLNQMANHFFAGLLSWLLNIKIKDSLCGSKAVRRSEYQKILQSNLSLKDRDPFGDFDLLFCASKLGLTITDVPVPYYPRTYGKSNINHVRDGFKLLGICWYIYRTNRKI